MTAGDGGSTDPIDQILRGFWDEEYLKGAAESLRERATRRVAEDPEADLAGVVLAPDAAEIRFVGGKQGASVPGGPIAELLPREDVLEIVRKAAPEVKEWLDGKGLWDLLLVPSTGKRRLLLVYIAAKERHRAGVFTYEVEG